MQSQVIKSSVFFTVLINDGHINVVGDTCKVISTLSLSLPLGFHPPATLKHLQSAPVTNGLHLPWEPSPLHVFTQMCASSVMESEKISQEGKKADKSN